MDSNKANRSRIPGHYKLYVLLFVCFAVCMFWDVLSNVVFSVRMVKLKEMGKMAYIMILQHLFIKVIFAENFGFICSTKTVLLADIEPPSFLQCPTSITKFADRAKTTTPVTWTVPSATDNSIAGEDCSGPSSVTIAHVSGSQPGSQLEIGIHEISYTAKDLSDNTGYCNFSVVVEGNAILLNNLKDRLLKTIEFRRSTCLLINKGNSSIPLFAVYCCVLLCIISSKLKKHFESPLKLE